MMKPTPKKPEPVPVSSEVRQAVADSQRLINFIAREGSLSLSPDMTKIIIDAKFKLEEGDWTPDDESNFLVHYDQLAREAWPVTVESINAIVPEVTAKKRPHTQAEQSVAWYRRFTLVTLLLLVITQVYWLTGHDLRSNLQALFEQREEMLEKTPGVTSADLLASDNAVSKENRELSVLNQKLDANYKLLLTWNRVWLFGGELNSDMPEYFKKEITLRINRLTQASTVDQQQVDNLELKQSLHKVRIQFFQHILAADFILEAFQSYVLPLLYGLFGAFIYVLRDLMREIKSLTYTPNNDVRYRLRLTLGALGGMVVGWFLKPDDVSGLASLSPMALAFLMGYNIEVLFSLMDKMINSIRQSVEGKQDSASTKS